MIITKEHQEALVSNYVKEKHTTDECIGFVDGLNKALELVQNLTIPIVSNRTFYCCKCGGKYELLAGDIGMTCSADDENKESGICGGDLIKTN